MSNFCITIGRHYGSGGREIGERLSKLLDFKFFNEEIVEIASKESGYAKEILEEADEKRTYSFADGVMVGSNSFLGNILMYNDVLSSDNLFKLTSDAIRKIASEGNCIIVGRCSDYILKGHPNMIKVFITCSDMTRRRERVLIRHPELNEKNVDSYITKIEKQRTGYYNFYTDQNRSNISNYDLVVDSGFFGVEESAEMIAKVVKHKFKI